jgi:hypothetical protein
MPTGLPGTELEFCLPRQVAIMDEPFCPVRAEAIRQASAGGLPGVGFRRVHGPEAGVVLNRWLAGNGFESAAMCRELELYGRLTGQPVITGDCVSPVLARVCGMHLAYYHVVANWGTGLEPEDPTLALDRLYVETLPEMAATLELTLLDRLEPTAACRCRALLRPRPRRRTPGRSARRRPIPGLGIFFSLGMLRRPADGVAERVSGGRGWDRGHAGGSGRSRAAGRGGSTRRG